MNIPKLKTLIVIGCGPHFREVYHQVIENADYQHRMILAIDLLSQKGAIESYFSTKKNVPESFLFLPEEYRNGISLDELDHLIRLKINPQEADGVIISTEPKVHKIYSLWALQYGLDVFVDKPLTAFASPEKMDTLYEDYLEIAEALSCTQANFVISCERRANKGYVYLKQYLSSLIQETGLPITFIDIHFSDGRWLMPDEWERENHPRKYGYGVLLHSGYHYIDLLMTLIHLNEPIIPLAEQTLELHTLSNNSTSLFKLMTNEFYKKILKTDGYEECFNNKHLEKMAAYGESDFMAMGRLTHEGYVVTNFSLKLLNTSVSARNIYQKIDRSQRLTSKGGKLRQENVIIHVGQLCSIHLRSNPYHKLKPHDTEDFSLDILNHSHILQKEPLIQLKRSDFSQIYPDLSETESMNKKARQWQLTDFLNGGHGNSHLTTHRTTIHLLDRIYKQRQESLYAFTR